MAKKRFARCMGKDEFKKTKKTGILNDHGRGKVPVFDYPEYVEKRILGMTKNKKELREYFSRIGVREAHAIVVLKVDEKLAEENLRQKNGLKEYLIPEGTEVDMIYHIKL